MKAFYFYLLLFLTAAIFVTVTSVWLTPEAVERLSYSIWKVLRIVVIGLVIIYISVGIFKMIRNNPKLF